MIIQNLCVKNFRCLKDASLTFAELTALVGGNGAGKSAFLKALDLFYSANPRCTSDDFYAGETKNPIEIEVTFSALNDEERKLFGSYIQDDSLSVVRVFTTTENRLYGTTLQNPDFQSIRSASNATEMRNRYLELKNKTEYSTLAKWTKKDDAEEFLLAWEKQNPKSLARCRDDGQFFGFKEVARGYLGRSTRYLYIPAVRDAAVDSQEGRGSVITVLMDLVVRSVLEVRDDVKNLKAQFQEKYGEVFNSANLPELADLGVNLSTTLRQFVPDSTVDLSWAEFDEVQVPLPKAGVELTEDGYRTPVDRTGNGLQRAFILALLQHLAIAQAKSEVKRSAQANEVTSKFGLPNLILGIEEPELYQHPSRQRHLAQILLNLATGKLPGVSDNTQVVYSTHSPLFVSLDRFNQVRLVRKKNPENEGPRVTTVIAQTLDTVAERIWILEGSKCARYTGASLKSRLAAVMTPRMNEGFFANTVVLVEGESDVSFFEGLARAKGVLLDSQDIALIPCNGKTELHKAAVVFESLGIPTYCIWDSDAHLGLTEGKCDRCDRPLDKKGDPQLNWRLLRLVERSEEDWPDHVGVRSASFKTHREGAIGQDLGETVFDELLKIQMLNFGYQKRDQAVKNPEVIAGFIQDAAKRGLNLGRFELILESICALKGAPNQFKQNAAGA